MAKRYRATDIWKKPFIKSLPAVYKLFWFYLLDDCDHAGIWQVDFEVAELRVGEKLNPKTAIAAFGDKIQVFDNGTKWFIVDFIEFQYGELNEKNKVHKSVIDILRKNKLGSFKGLASPLQDAKDKDKEKDKDKDKDQDKDITTISELEREEVTALVMANEIWLEGLKMTHRGKDIPQAWNECYTHWMLQEHPPNTIKEWQVKLNSWLSNKKAGQQKPNQYQQRKFVA